MTGEDAGAAALAPDAPPAEPLRVEVTHGAPTDEELAALMAVVGAAYAQERAAETVDNGHRRSGWSLSQRGLRAPLRRELGWGRYGG